MKVKIYPKDHYLNGRYEIEAEVQDLIGLHVQKVEINECDVKFYTGIGIFNFYHEQDCCEYVRVEDYELTGSFEDCIIMQAEEVICDAEQAYESGTWTFYKFRSDKGYLDIRFLGESNGYYSESVSTSFLALPNYKDDDYALLKENIKNLEIYRVDKEPRLNFDGGTRINSWTGAPILYDNPVLIYKQGE